jgi:hypothetical protein
MFSSRSAPQKAALCVRALFAVAVVGLVLLNRHDLFVRRADAPTLSRISIRVPTLSEYVVDGVRWVVRRATNGRPSIMKALDGETTDTVSHFSRP